MANRLIHSDIPVLGYSGKPSHQSSLKLWLNGVSPGVCLNCSSQESKSSLRYLIDREIFSQGGPGVRPSRLPFMRDWRKNERDMLMYCAVSRSVSVRVFIFVSSVTVVNNGEHMKHGGKMDLIKSGIKLDQLSED